MKNYITKLILIAGFIIASTALMAQTLPPPPPQGGHGQGGNVPAGGAAPIGGGIAILLTLGAAYGAKKMYDARKRLNE